MHQEIIAIVEGLKSLIDSSTKLHVAPQLQEEYSVFDIFNDIDINAAPTAAQLTMFAEPEVAAMLEDRHARLLHAISLTNIVPRT